MSYVSLQFLGLLKSLTWNFRGLEIVPGNKRRQIVFFFQFFLCSFPLLGRLKSGGCSSCFVL